MKTKEQIKKEIEKLKKKSDNLKENYIETQKEKYIQAKVIIDCMKDVLIVFLEKINKLESIHEIETSCLIDCMISQLKWVLKD